MSAHDGRPDPAYRRLADELAAHLAMLPPGSRVPSEHELCASHGVSRLTVRAAFRELEHQMLVRRVRGSGTFVAHRLRLVLGTGRPDPLLVARASGVEALVDVVSTRTRRPVASVRDRLELDDDERVATVVAVGRIEGVPAWHTTIHVPADLHDDLAAELADALTDATPVEERLGARWGVHLSPVRVAAQQLVAPDDVVPVLGARALTWLVETDAMDRSLGRPVLATSTWLRSDVFEVRVEVTLDESS